MRLFFGALVLNFILFSNEIQASGLRRVSTLPYQNDQEGIDHLVTSRRPTQSSSTYNNPPLLAHQALDLGGHQSYDPQSLYPQSHGYHPHPQESLPQVSHGNRPHPQESLQPESHGYQSYSQEPLSQLDPAEVSYLVNKYKFVNGRLPELDSPGFSFGNNPQNNYHKKPENSQDYSKQENIEWLLEHYREFEIDVRRQQYIEKQIKMEQMKMQTSEMVSMPSMRRSRCKNYQKESEFPRKKPSQEQENPEKQRTVRIKEPVSSQNNIEESAMYEHANSEIGLRSKGKATCQTNVSGSRAKGKAASRKDASGSRAKGKAAGRRNVSDSHDQLSQQSQHSEHDFSDFEPTLIPPHMSNYNPYLEFPQNDLNHQQNWNHPGGSGSG